MRVYTSFLFLYTRIIMRSGIGKETHDVCGEPTANFVSGKAGYPFAYMLSRIRRTFRNNYVTLTEFLKLCWQVLRKQDISAEYRWFHGGSGTLFYNKETGPWHTRTHTLIYIYIYQENVTLSTKNNGATTSHQMAFEGKKENNQNNVPTKEGRR